jgi:hypothetical protein
MANAIDASKGNLGTESRSQILPNTNVDEIGFTLPEYDFAGNLPRPNQIGVRDGGSISDVIDAAKGVIYYTDVIGFGESSNFMTRGMPFSPLGINFFMKSGLKCPNGEDMYMYFEGIPRGDGLGKNIEKAMSELGMPKLRGLAPGMIEDTKDGLNPRPILQATFGSPYPKCVKQTLPVGDAKGLTRDAGTGDVWVKGDVQSINGRPHQTRWVQAKDGKGNPIFLSKAEFEKEASTFKKEGFTNRKQGQAESFLLGILLLGTAVLLARR